MKYYYFPKWLYHEILPRQPDPMLLRVWLPRSHTDILCEFLMYIIILHIVIGISRIRNHWHFGHFVNGNSMKIKVYFNSS